MFNYIYLGGSLALMGVFKVKETIAALANAALLQVLEEGLVGSVARSNHLDVDLFFVFYVKDNITVLLVLLDLLVSRLTDVSYCYTGSL